MISTAEYAAWRSLWESEDSKFIALTMPRFLGRLLYGDETDPVDEFAYQESHSAPDLNTYVWCNSAYAMGTNITRPFKNYGWCARIRGVESGIEIFSRAVRKTGGYANNPIGRVSAGAASGAATK